MHFPKTPALLQQLFPDLLCRVEGEGNVVYLTFDDGPTPGVTEEVLDILAQYQAKATFFCLGKQVQQNAELYNRVQTEGHRTGSHGQNHLDGWRTATETYLKDMEMAESFIKTNLFRPPYGRLRPAQYLALRKRYRIVLWDVMPGDFKTDLSPQDCYQTLARHVQPGSVIVLHDTERAYPCLKEILPRFLEEFAGKGYTFADL